MPIKWIVPSEGHFIQMCCININKSRQRIDVEKKMLRKHITTTQNHLNTSGTQELKRYSLSKYIWDIRKEWNEMSTLKRSVVKFVPPYSNMLKKCLLCLHEKLEVVNFEEQDHLLNKRSEQISKCRHASNYLLHNYKAND